MSTYTWPAAWQPRRFRMQVMPNERAFTGYYSGQSQALDLLGEFWTCQMELPPSRSEDKGADMEAFFERLHGRVNLVSLWNLARPAPRGTMRGTPTLNASVAQLADTVAISSTAGATLKAGDMIGLGGQVSRVMADYTANGSGLFSAVEIWPRARTAMSGGAAVTWDKPTMDFRLTDGQGVPIDWEVGKVFQGPLVSLSEA